VKHDETEGENVWDIVGHKYIWVALNIPLRKSFNHPIDLLCFPGKTNVHQKPTQSNIQRVPSKRELSDVEFESSYILDPNNPAISALPTREESLCKNASGNSSCCGRSSSDGTDESNGGRDREIGEAVMKLPGAVPDFAEAVDDAKKLIESRCRRGGFVAERGRLFA
jgi:hypothetical protein